MEKQDFSCIKNNKFEPLLKCFTYYSEDQEKKWRTTMLKDKKLQVLRNNIKKNNRGVTDIQAAYIAGKLAPLFEEMLKSNMVFGIKELYIGICTVRSSGKGCVLDLRAHNIYIPNKLNRQSCIFKANVFMNVECLIMTDLIIRKEDIVYEQAKRKEAQQTTCSEEKREVSSEATTA